MLTPESCRCKDALYGVKTGDHRTPVSILTLSAKLDFTASFQPQACEVAASSESPSRLTTLNFSPGRRRAAAPRAGPASPVRRG